MTFSNTIFSRPKFKHPSPRGFCLVMILFLIGNLFLISCVQESEVPTAIHSESGQLAKIKAWFEENESKLRLSGGGTNLRMASQELILLFLKRSPIGINFITTTFRMDEKCLRSVWQMLPSTFQRQCWIAFPTGIQQKL